MRYRSGLRRRPGRENSPGQVLVIFALGITVRATYHLDLIVPLISAFLPKDANGRMTIVGETTMVIN